MMDPLMRTFCMVLAGAFLLRVAGPCNCGMGPCNSTPRTWTPGIYFHLKDNAGNDILHFPGTGTVPAPDSIKLKNAATGVFYNLLVSQSATENSIYSLLYNRPANVVDSLIFYFGNSRPDTLLVYTGLVDGWRGDECPMIKDAGITKVMLRGQVLVETTYDYPVFTLRR